MPHYHYDHLRSQECFIKKGHKNTWQTTCPQCQETKVQKVSPTFKGLDNTFIHQQIEARGYESLKAENRGEDRDPVWTVEEKVKRGEEIYYADPFNHLLYDGEASKQYFLEHFEDPNSSYKYRRYIRHTEEAENIITMIWDIEDIEEMETASIKKRYAKQIELMEECNGQFTRLEGDPYTRDEYEIPGTHQVLSVPHNNSGYDAHFVNTANIIKNLGFESMPIIGTEQKIKHQTFYKEITLGPAIEYYDKETYEYRSTTRLYTDKW